MSEVVRAVLQNAVDEAERDLTAAVTNQSDCEAKLARAKECVSRATGQAEELRRAVREWRWRDVQ